MFYGDSWCEKSLLWLTSLWGKIQMPPKKIGISIDLCSGAYLIIALQEKIVGKCRRIYREILTTFKLQECLPREKPRDLCRFYFRFQNYTIKQKCYIGRYILERGQFKALNMIVIPVTEGSQPTHFSSPDSQWLFFSI